MDGHLHVTENDIVIFVGFFFPTNFLCHLLTDVLETLPRDVASSAIEVVEVVLYEFFKSTHSYTDFLKVPLEEIWDQKPDFYLSFSNTVSQFCDVIPRCKGI